MFLHYQSNTGFKEIYHPDKYFWPVFSIKNYKQDQDGWFNEVKRKRRQK